MKLSNEIKKLILTEKSANLRGSNIYTFKVDDSLNKNSIANLIEKLFGVNVLRVRTAIMPSKRKRIVSKNPKRFPQEIRVGRFKKAYVEIKEGQSIDLNVEENK
ncbi:MAG: 50S ribosomal protein L23 [Proteobacteria bacterium]|nr:50S ribosomal protein L23 [Pseudomonadota bacterium]